MAYFDTSRAFSNTLRGPDSDGSGFSRVGLARFEYLLKRLQMWNMPVIVRKMVPTLPGLINVRPYMARRPL